MPSDESAPLLPLQPPHESEWKIRPSSWFLVDLMVLSCGISLTFVGLVGAQQILTTLFPVVGPIALGVTYSTFAIACLTAPAVIRSVGLKAAIAIQLFCITLWLATNLRPSIELAVPASLLIGFFAGSFWVAVPTYITIISGRYDQLWALEADLGESDISTSPDAIEVGKSVSILSTLVATLRLTTTDARVVLMIPLFCYVGTEQGFFFSLFGSRLVAPVFGDAMVGTISIGFGVTNMVASLLLGRLTDAYGWPGPLAAGLIAHAGSLCVLMAWKVFDVLVIENNAKGIAVLYAIAGAWGFGDAAFNSVISTMLGMFFPPDVPESSTEAAFATMRLWSSLFTGICLFGLAPLRRSMSDAGSIAVELFVPLGMIVLASAGLVVLWLRRQTPVALDSTSSPATQMSPKSVGLFQGIFFGIFMSTFITGDALTGSILGPGKNPPQERINDLFYVFSSSAFGGFIIIALFLRRHTSGASGSIGRDVVSETRVN